MAEAGLNHDGSNQTCACMILSTISSMIGIGPRSRTWVDLTPIYEFYSFAFVATSLSQHYKRAKEKAEEFCEHFHGLCILQGRAKVDEWWNEEPKPHQKDGEWHSIYQLKERKGQVELIDDSRLLKLLIAPSQASILKEMIASEQRVEEGAEVRATTPVSLFINVGLKLQARQYVVHFFPEQI